MASFASTDYIRRTKRKPLACIQCRLRKVRCDKKIPCKNCLERGTAKECRREVVLLRGNVANKEDEERKNISERRLFNEFEIENIRMCVEKLTFGFNKVDRLFKSESQKEVNWPQFHIDFTSIMARIDHATSHCLCSFASSYINFIHNAVVPDMFIDEHETFWNEHVADDPACLVYSRLSKLQTELPRDYYFWMALYYGTLCNGIYFGSEQLKSELNFSEHELKTLGPKLFTAAYDCLCRAEFMSHADVRAVQVFCLLSTCFHAYGSVELSQSLLIQCIRIARKLGLDKPRRNSVTFSSEVKKRLWYTLCLNDWLDQIEKPRFYVEVTQQDFPHLLTDEELSQEDQVPRDFTATREYCNIFYQHVMIKMALIKKCLYESHFSALATLDAWTKMSDLRASTITFFSDWPEPTSESLLTYDYARFLLFSSLTEEMLDLGRRVLAIVGKQTWLAKYRSKCIEAALGNISRATAPIPSYYRRHWIVVQHLIYAALTILLDIIMFPGIDSPNEMGHRLDQVESTFVVFEELEATHLPAKLGIAVLPKLCKLVRFVIVEKREGNTFEKESLKYLLNDLQVNVSPVIDSVPGRNKPQYLRAKNVPQIQAKPGERQQSDSESTSDGNLLDDEMQKLFFDTGWSEVLMNVFQPAFNQLQ